MYVQFITYYGYTEVKNKLTNLTRSTFSKPTPMIFRMIIDGRVARLNTSGAKFVADIIGNDVVIKTTQNDS